MDRSNQGYRAECYDRLVDIARLSGFYVTEIERLHYRIGEVRDRIGEVRDRIGEVRGDRSAVVHAGIEFDEALAFLESKAAPS